MLFFLRLTIINYLTPLTLKEFTMNQIEQWTQHLTFCVSSCRVFSIVAPEILFLLQQDNPEYTNFFFNQISQFIILKQLPPQDRFYCLYLLFKATENDDLASKGHLLQDVALLSFLYRSIIQEPNKTIALDERGKKFFAIQLSTAEAILGVNFVRLCLECLMTGKIR